MPWETTAQTTVGAGVGRIAVFVLFGHHCFSKFKFFICAESLTFCFLAGCAPEAQQEGVHRGACKKDPPPGCSAAVLPAGFKDNLGKVEDHLRSETIN